MSTIDKYKASEYVKLLAVGDPKSGKTGSLISLVQAGYKLRILDMDNLLHILAALVREKCPDLAHNVEARTLRDKYRMTKAGPMIAGAPVAYLHATDMLNRWKYKPDGEEEIDLGVPAEWGPDHILVIDSLSRLCDAAYDWQEALTPKGQDGRAVYGNSQDAVEHTIAGLTSDTFCTNLIVMAHLAYMDIPDGRSPDGTTKKAFPQGIGKALSPKIPQYFPSVVRYMTSGDKRMIYTSSGGLIDLANPKPFTMAKSYPTETGLAEFFAVLQEPPKVKPTKATLRRV